MYFTTFMQACEHGDLSLVQEWLSPIARIDLKQSDLSGQTPLIIAARENHLDIVKLLVGQSDPKQADNGGHSALLWAVYHDNTQMATLLIPGSDLRHVDVRGRTALMHAAIGGRAEVAKLLIPGSDLRQVDGTDRTSLMCAAIYGDTKMVRLLLSGSDLQAKDIEGQTALQLALDGEHWGCVDILACADPGFDAFTWPEQARPEDLPQWFASVERRALAVQVQQAPQTHEPPAPRASRTVRARL